MLQSSLLALVLLVSPMQGMKFAAPPAAEAAAAAPAEAAAIAPATQPSGTSNGNAAAATQPASVDPFARATDHHTESIGEIFGRTRVGQLFEGKKKVNLDDVRDPMFWLETARDLLVTILSFIPRVIVALLFMVFFWGIYRMIRRLVIGSLNAAHVDPSIRDMLGHLLKWSIMGFGVVIACNQIGVQIAALLTGVSIIGLAVGFAAQETLANFIAGVVIFWDKPFKVGEWVEIETTYGKVCRVTFRSTRILDLNGQLVVYPNTYMLSHRVSNHTAHPLTRVLVPLTIKVGEPIDLVRHAMLQTTRGDRRLASDPAPTVVVDACQPDTVTLLLRFWIRDESLEWALRYEYMEKCKIALEGISPAPEHSDEPMPLRKAG
jgi:small conductance mechanosensitive channel